MPPGYPNTAALTRSLSSLCRRGGWDVHTATGRLGVLAGRVGVAQLRMEADIRPVRRELGCLRGVSAAILENDLPDRLRLIPPRFRVRRGVSVQAGASSVSGMVMGGCHGSTFRAHGCRDGDGCAGWSC